MDTLAFPFELKSIDANASGEIVGYGAIFHTSDSHGDVIKPGAFGPSLKARTEAGRTLPMYIQHGPHVGGDHLPAGVWTSVHEDAVGLKVAGRIAGMDTDRGKLVRSLVRDGALSGLSIEYHVPPGGASYGKSAAEPKRTIQLAELHGVSLVADPSHPKARVSSIKSRPGEIEIATIDDLRDLLREHGFGSREAKAMAGAAWKARSTLEDDDEAAATAAIAEILTQSAARIAGRA